MSSCLEFPYFPEFVIIEFFKNLPGRLSFILVYVSHHREMWKNIHIKKKMNLGNHALSYCGTSFYDMPYFNLLQSVLEGYNGTIMAYGQTGTGKTYTLGRLGEEDTAARGIMVRAMEDIFADVSLETDSVSVSYLQVLSKKKYFGMSF